MEEPAVPIFSEGKESCKTYHPPGKKEDTPQRDGGPGPPPIRETNIYIEIQVTRAPSIAVDKNNRKIYQREKPPPPITNNSGHLTPYRQ
jgi:hypothetical protein